MPTSYTAPVGDGELNFNQFVWRCARAMGALVSMRDESLDAPIPEKIEASSHHQGGINAAKARKARLEAMTEDEIAAEAKSSYEEAVERRLQMEKERLLTKANYERMLAQVQAWIPPTSDHEGLKKFMIEQLQESIRFDCSPLSELSAPQMLSAKEWRHAEANSIGRDLAYHRRELAEEAKRVRAVNEWLSDLRTSVPPPTK
jgi:hypothetical protein